MSDLRADPLGPDKMARSLLEGMGMEIPTMLTYDHDEDGNQIYIDKDSNRYKITETAITGGTKKEITGLNIDRGFERITETGGRIRSQLRNGSNSVTCMNSGYRPGEKWYSLVIHLPQCDIYIKGGSDAINYKDQKLRNEHRGIKGCRYADGDMWITIDGKEYDIHKGKEDGKIGEIKRHTQEGSKNGTVSADYIESPELIEIWKLVPTIEEAKALIQLLLKENLSIMIPEQRKVGDERAINRTE